MTDSRRDFLLRFAAATLTTAAAGCSDIVTEQPPPPNVVYGPPPFRPDAEFGPGSVNDFVANVGDRVFFDAEKANLRTDAKAMLTKQAAWLRQFATYIITVEGHADERGTREYNLALGDRRATSVKTFLVANGVAAARIKTISYGKERPLALGANESAWAQNRRGVITLSK